MINIDTIVIGAGPSGLSLAYHLQGNTMVLEKEDRVGGLCRSFNFHGGFFDIGGHSFHTPFPEVRDLVMRLMAGGMEEFRRDARVYTHGSLIPYPFQKNFEQIPLPEVVRECQLGLEEAKKDSNPKNYEEYIVQRFGKGIARHFMLPYNRKLWGADLTRMLADWSAERVSGAKGEEEKFLTEGGKRTPLQADSCVAYPGYGGFEEIYKRMASKIRLIKCNQTVIKIDPINKTVQTKTGDAYSYQKLVSTIPLPELLRIIDGIPQRLIELSDQLDYLPLRVEMILIDSALPDAPQRVYSADPDIPPHKIAFNHTSSKFLRSLSYHAITAEISMIHGKKVEEGSIFERTVNSIIKMGIINTTKSVTWNNTIEVQYGYPVYTHQRPMIVQEIKQCLEEFNIFTLGRFGEWEYINSDNCIWRGMNLAKHLDGYIP